ncbi:MAG: hypothetical protein VB142_10040 [Burkholderia sp.]
MKLVISMLRISSPGMHALRIGAAIVVACLLPADNVAVMPAISLRFALPGGATIVYDKAVYDKALNPHDPLPRRFCKRLDKAGSHSHAREAR